MNTGDDDRGPCGNTSVQSSARAWTLTACAAAVIAAAVVGGLAIRDGGAAERAPTRSGVASGPPPELRVLQRPVREADREAAGGAWIASTTLDRDAIRLIRSEAGSDWIAGRTSDGRICLVMHTSTRNLSACETPHDVALDHGLSVGFRRGVKDWVIAALVTDDVARVRSQAGAPGVSPVESLVVFEEPAVRTLETFVDGDWTSTLSAGSWSSALRFSILEQPPSPRDALPEAIASGRVKSKPGLPDPPITAHWALSTSGGRTFWVVGSEPGILCLIDAPEHVGCAGTILAEYHGALLLGTRDLAGIAPDGYDTATIGEYLSPITNNVFFFPTLPPGTPGPLVLRGPAGTREVPLA